MQKDLVCGMDVNETKAGFKSTYAGVSYYFCSLECQETFKRLAKVFARDTIESMSPTRVM
ncbi:MAG: YHS domain-containing protein [Nitrososphaerales archaeon]|nr:YHS domain-containing protein [Nitrososphaerales archaeon]